MGTRAPRADAPSVPSPQPIGPHGEAGAAAGGGGSTPSPSPGSPWARMAERGLWRAGRVLLPPPRRGRVGVGVGRGDEACGTWRGGDAQSRASSASGRRRLSARLRRSSSGGCLISRCRALGGVDRLDGREQRLLLGIARALAQEQVVGLRGKGGLVAAPAGDAEAARREPGLDLVLEHHALVERIAEQLELEADAVLGEELLRALQHEPFAALRVALEEAVARALARAGELREHAVERADLDLDHPGDLRALLPGPVEDRIALLRDARVVGGDPLRVLAQQRGARAALAADVERCPAVLVPDRAVLGPVAAVAARGLVGLEAQHVAHGTGMLAPGRAEAADRADVDQVDRQQGQGLRPAAAPA